jgi:hypothetical protein
MLYLEIFLMLHWMDACHFFYVALEYENKNLLLLFDHILYIIYNIQIIYTNTIYNIQILCIILY